MNRLLTAALALTLLSGTAAIAQPNGHFDDYHGRYDEGRHDNGRYEHGHHDRHDNRNGHGGRQWARGQRLPSAYYHDRGHYIDYRVYHLRAPPRGYQWVEADNSYALVALATGLIASIVIANHY